MHAMIDFETLSLAKDAALISCGIVLFSSAGIEDTFYINIKPDQRQHVCPNTVAWWAKQSDEAKAALDSDKVEFTEAMKRIRSFLSLATHVWSHGATADIVWLESAFALAGITCPITYRNYRCFRTAMALKPNTRWERPTIPHNALEDAKAQALTLISAYGEDLDYA